MTARTAAVVVFVLVAIGFAIWFFLPANAGTAPPRAIELPAAPERAPTESRAPAPPTAADLEPIEGRPFSEDPAAAGRPAQPGPARLEVVVVNADGAPVRGALVVAHTPSGDWMKPMHGIEPARTREGGIVRINPGAATHLVVGAAGYPPVLVKIDDPARMRVTLPGDATLRARVRVNGSAPKEPLRFVLRGYDDPTLAWPETARIVARELGFTELRMPLETDAAGEMAAHGVLRGSTVALQIPEGYLPADARPDSDVREISAVANGEVIPIDLAAMQALTGTVVGKIVDTSRGNRNAASFHPGIDVRYVLARADSPTPITGKTPVESGRFKIHFLAPLQGAVLEVWDQWPERKLAEKKVDGPIAASTDVGEIQLIAPPKMVLFHVMNDTGHPLAGGRVLAGDTVSSKSDAEGRTALGIPEGTSFVVAGAPGHKITRVQLPEELPEELDLRLEPAASLIIRVRHEDPAIDLHGLQVELSYDVDDVTGPADSSWEFRDVRGAQAGSMGRIGMKVSGPGGRIRQLPQRQSNRYSVEAGKDITVGGFKKGDEIAVKVEDQFEQVIMEETIKLTEDEPKPIELVIRSRPQRLRVIVRDHQDRPLPGARVSNGNALFRRFTAQTDAGGACEFLDVYGEQAQVVIEATGHVTKSAQVQVSEKPAEVRLERARQLTVELIGPVPQGKEQVHVVFETEDGAAFGASPRGERFFSFDAVPCRPGTIKATWSDQVSTIPIGAEETRAQIARPQ